MDRSVNYILVGQGLAGSALAWELTRRGRSVMVFDQPSSNRSSAVAAGIYNPITGRVMTPTWKAETIFPFLEKFYTEAEIKLNEKFLHAFPVYRPFLNEAEKKSWKQKSERPELREFVLRYHDVPAFEDQVINPWGGIEINHSGHLAVKKWMDLVRSYLKGTDSFVEEYFDVNKLQVDDGVKYDSYCADKVIFCDGLSSLETNWWNWLPLKPLKGETLEVTLTAVPRRLFNRGAYIVPGETKGHYIIGATYQHPPFPESPTSEGQAELENKVKGLVHMPIKVVHQWWGIRPTVPDRRPLLGPHPANKNVVIFNGLGTKGVSLAPYFAGELAQWLEGSGPLSDEVNISRFKALYSE